MWITIAIQCVRMMNEEKIFHGEGFVLELDRIIGEIVFDHERFCMMFVNEIIYQHRN